MHRRSLNASVEPNAQQEPQSAWSRMWDRRVAQELHLEAVRASNEVGREPAGTVVLGGSLVRKPLCVPHRLLA